MRFELSALSKSILLALSLTSTIALVRAEESTGSGSLDSLWSDQGGTQPKASMSISSTATPVSAPLVSMEQFNSSDLVKKGAWPGIGPFKSNPEDPLTLIDPNNNLLRLETADAHLLGCELTFTIGQSEQTALDLEMASDFLLEACGSKPKAIVEFNRQIEQSKLDTFFKTDGQPLAITSGNLLISITRQGTQNKSSQFLVRVRNRNASEQAIKQHSQTLVQKPADDSKGKPETNKIATAQTPDLKSEFATCLKNWQQVKKTAIRQRDAQKLSSILSGKALVKQSEALKWLATNHKYFEMVPGPIVVTNFSELIADKKYAVNAEVKESSKYIDEVSGQTLKDTEDFYKVTYTVEKIGEHWFIVDSNVISSKSTPNRSH